MCDSLVRESQTVHEVEKETICNKSKRSQLQTVINKQTLRSGYHNKLCCESG